MTSLKLSTLVDETSAWQLLSRRSPQLKRQGAKLHYHPFAGFVFDMPTVLGRSQTVHSLVDYYTGKAFLTGPWKGTEEPVHRHEQVQDPQWNTVNLEEAQLRAERTVGAANLRRTRLAGRGGLSVKHRIPTVWKPNWKLDATLGEQQFQIMVDGLNGGYFVLGS